MSAPATRHAAGVGGVGAAASVILVWALTLTGLEVPPEVAAAFAALLTAAVGWTRERSAPSP